MKKLFFTLTIIGFIIITGFTIRFSEENIAYPEGYRNWVHIKTGLVTPENPNFKFSGGFHHIYANEIAMKGYMSGNFPEGSVLVFDVLDAITQNGNIQESTRNHVDVMVKDSLKFASTGGWGFEEFKGDSHTEKVLTTAVKTTCANCHAKQSNYVFSKWRK